MIFYTKKIKNICFDFSFFHKVRNKDDGITFIEFTGTLDLFKNYHNPKFSIMLIFLNYKIFEITVGAVKPTEIKEPYTLVYTSIGSHEDGVIPNSENIIKNI